jgi:transposase
MSTRARTLYPKRTQAQWLVVKREAVARFAQGQSLDAIAQELHVSYDAIRVWFHKWEDGGDQAACAQQSLGAKPRLCAAQLAQLEAALIQGPPHWGHKTDVWTLARIAGLIYKLFGVRYHPSHVFKILGRMGWSCQRPTRRAKERDEAAIAKWLREDWPRIKKGHRTPEPQ